MYDGPRVLLSNDVAHRLHGSPDAVCKWERLGLLQAQRTARGARLLDRADVDRLAVGRAQTVRGGDDGAVRVQQGQWARRSA